MAIILSQLSTRDLACLAATCRSLWCGAAAPPPMLPTPGPVETEMWRRAEARGLHIGSSLPGGALAWVPYLLKRDDALRREAPLAVGQNHSIFVDREGRLHLTCHRAAISAGNIGEPLLGHDWGSDDAPFSMHAPPTLAPSMQDKRIVSVATGGAHCLALSAQGEVYSWGAGAHGALGHADGGRDARAEEDRDAGADRDHRGWSAHERSCRPSRTALHLGPCEVGDYYDLTKQSGLRT